MSNNTTVNVTLLAGAITTILVWVAYVLGLDVPAPVGAAVTTVLVGVAGLLLPPHKS